MPSNGESTVRWGHADDLLFELSSGDADLIKQALTVFCPWLTRRTATPLCHWQVERKSDKFASAGARWQVQEDGTSDVFTRDTPEKALLAVEFSAVMKCDECCHYLSLHGALLSKNHRGVVIVGPCEAGKSTLSCSLWQHGWSFLCDDVTLVDAEAGWAYPTPRRVSLRTGSRKLLGEKLWSHILATPSCVQTDKGYIFHPSDVERRPPPKATKLAAVIFLARRNTSTAPAQLLTIEPANALLSLLPYSNFIRQLDPGEALRRIQPLADSVPAYDLGRGDLVRMVQQVERLIA